VARFVLKYLLNGRPNRNRPDQAVDRDRLVLGSRPSADLFVKERLVGSEAAVIAFDGTRLTVEILDDFAGAFLEGRPVAGRVPFPDGASLQVGYLLVKPAIDAAKATCTLTVSEGYLPSTVEWFVKQEKPEKGFALESSGPQEHLWGASPVLRRLNGIAFALGAAALLAFPLLKDTSAVTRGTLARHHQAGSVEGAPKGCADCHDPFRSDYGPRCATCHKGFEDESVHPYAAAKEISCASCHEDHRGADAALAPDIGTASPDAWPPLCARCHGPMPGRTARAVRDRAANPTTRVLAVDGFSHRDHRTAEGKSLASGAPGVPGGGKLPVACADCHRPKPGAAPGAGPPPPAPAAAAAAAFGPVPYARCIDCHATWSVPTHGRDRGGAACLRCHVPAADPSKITKDLRKAELAASGSRFVLPPRRHDFRADECLRCHVLDRAPKDGKTPIGEKVFRHDHHLESVSPPGGTGLFASRRCLECHRSVAASEGMAGVPLADVDGCVKCHTDGAPVAVADPAAGRRTVTDMFHRVHVLAPGDAVRDAAPGSPATRDSVRAGCLACHLPAEGEAPMAFRPGTADCSACHTRHENVGEGKCALCHLDRAYEGNRGPDGKVRYRFNERGIFEASAATTKPRGAVERFDHFSRGHRDGKCSLCHDEKAVDPADRVLDVPLPRPDAPACLECHQRTRYHR
jgi:hypothetical protein